MKPHKQFRHDSFVALAGMLGLALAATAQAAPIDLPDIPQCTELAPGAISVDSTPVTLRLRVLLDGVSAGEAAQTLATAMGSYAPLNIGFDASYASASFGSVEGLALIEEAKQFYGGTRPPGIDLVYVITNKNLTTGLTGDALVGQADCIGGVAYADQGFAVGEAGADFGAKTMAHELGHLLGGQHQYANCVEALAKGGDNLCTLMFNDVGFAALPFSTLNGVVVRGHAQLAGNASAALSDSSASGDRASASAGDSAAPAASGGGLSWLSIVGLLVARFSRRLGRQPAA